MSFENIVGNDNVKEILENIIKSKKLTHSYMFIGTAGIGKSLFAKEFAKMILCESESKPCGKCKSCLEIDNNNNPDLIEIEPESGTIKIDTIRKMRRESIRKTNYFK